MNKVVGLTILGLIVVGLVWWWSADQLGEMNSTPTAAVEMSQPSEDSTASTATTTSGAGTTTTSDIDSEVGSLDFNAEFDATALNDLE